MARSEFSEMIEFIQQVTGYTQSKVARRMGVSQSTVSDWTSGTTTPRPDKRKILKSWYEEVRKAHSDKKHVLGYQEILTMTSRMSTTQAMQTYREIAFDLSAPLLDIFYGHWYAAQIEFLQGKYQSSLRKNRNLTHFADCFELEPNIMAIACSYAVAQIDLFQGKNLRKVKNKLEAHEGSSGHTPLADAEYGLLGVHSEVMRLCVLAFCYCLLGDLQQALRVIDRCHRFASNHGDSFRAVALSWEADIYYANGYWKEALKAAEKGLELSQDNLPLVTAIANIHIGNCRAAVHKDMHSIDRIKEGLSLLEKLNFNFAWSFWLEIMASAYFQLNKFDEALATVDEAIAFGNRIGETVWLPRILGTKARILGKMGKKHEREQLELLSQARELAGRVSFGLDFA